MGQSIQQQQNTLIWTIFGSQNTPQQIEMSGNHMYVLRL